MKRLWSRQIVVKHPGGNGKEMAMAPFSPVATGSPLAPNTLTLKPGVGTLDEPGLVLSGSMPIGFEQMGQPVSVCHQ